MYKSKFDLQQVLVVKIETLLGGIQLKHKVQTVLGSESRFYLLKG